MHDNRTDVSSWNRDEVETPIQERHEGIMWEDARSSDAQAHLPRTDAESGKSPLSATRATRKPLLSLVIVSSLLIVISAWLLPSLLTQPATSMLTIPRQYNSGLGTSDSVGTVAFSSSGQLSPDSATGLNDVLFVSLSVIASPKLGAHEDAWLEADATQDALPALFLGTLNVVEGKATLVYQDRQHTNLLAHYSRLLITEEADGVKPSVPPLNMSTWRYSARIPDIPTPGDEKGYSLLSHLRHLLAADPTLQKIGLQGGLDIWLYRNLGKVLEWSNAARDDWASPDVSLTRRQIDRVVQYLDGQSYAFRDLPADTPWLVDPHAGRPGLIDFDTPQDEQGPPSYVSHVRLHLTGMVNAPGHTPEQQHLAEGIDTALATIEALLKQARKDAVQLAHMTDEQLKLPAALTLLNQLQTTANDAYVGQTDEAGNLRQGETWIHDQMQRLASFTIESMTTNGP